MVSQGFVDNRSPPRVSATDGEADQESDDECHAETRRVDEWDEARSSLGDLERPDRAGGHAGAAATSASFRLSVPVPSRSATRPKPIAHTGDRDHSPSADVNRIAVHVAHARTDLEVIAQRAQRLCNLHHRPMPPTLVEVTAVIDG